MIEGWNVQIGRNHLDHEYHAILWRPAEDCDGCVTIEDAVGEFALSARLAWYAAYRKWRTIRRWM